MLDQNSNGLIDSIELFTIMCIFSDCREEDKMLFLFDVFDFNGRGWLEAADIEFMMFVIVQGLVKIFGVESESIENDGSTGHAAYNQLMEMLKL